MSGTYARIYEGAVAELFAPPAGVPIGECFTPALAASFVEVPTGVAPAQGWTYTGGTFAAPAPPPAPTLAQQAWALVNGGLALTITGSLTLDATFPCDPPTQLKLSAVQQVLSVTGKFPGGGATYPMRDAAGTWHQLTPAQYTAIATAVATFVAACDLVVDGASSTLPSPSAAVVTA